MFTQTTVDEEGWPIREPDSTTYVGAIETAEEFGFRIYTEAWRRGWEWATIKVVIGDGAVWIWNLAHQHFPGAIQIVDLYHARQHLWKIAALLHPQDQVAKKVWMIPMKDLLDDGNIETLVTHLREIAVTHAAAPAGLAQWQLGFPQRRVALVMEPGWKSPSWEICWSSVVLSSTKAGNGSVMGSPLS